MQKRVQPLFLVLTASTILFYICSQQQRLALLPTRSPRGVVTMRIRSGFISNSSTSSFILALPDTCNTCQDAEEFIGKDTILDNLRAHSSDCRCDVTTVLSKQHVVQQLSELKAMCAALHPDGEACHLFDEAQCCKMCAMLNKRIDTLVPEHSSASKADALKHKPPVCRNISYFLNPILTCFECFSEFLAHCIAIRDWSNKLARELLPSLCRFPAGSSDPPAKSERKRAENERHNMQQPINALPNPVLLGILSSLRLNEAVGPCMLVCRRWAALKLSARPTEDATACGVFWKPQAIGYLRDLMRWKARTVFQTADVDACISPGFSGATQWQYLALSAFARWIRSRCAKASRHTEDGIDIPSLTLMTQPYKAITVFQHFLGDDRWFQDKPHIVFGGSLLLEMAKVYVSDGYVWQFLEWAREREEGKLGFGKMGGEGASSDVDSSIEDKVFYGKRLVIEGERKRCEEKRNERIESAAEEWGFGEMWVEQEQRDREEEEERRKEEAERRKRYGY